MNKIKIIGLIAFIVFAISFVFIQSSASAQNGGIKVSFDGSLKGLVQEIKDILAITTEQPKAETSVGAIASPDIPYNYIGIGGHRKQIFGRALTQATTTLCSFDPDFGTTTLRAYGAQFTVASSSATRVTFGKGTDTNSTSTPFWEGAIGANASATFHIVATSSVTGLNQTHSFAPGETLQLTLKGGDQGGDYTGLVPEGSCFAEFDVH